MNCRRCALLLLFASYSLSIPDAAFAELPAPTPAAAAKPQITTWECEADNEGFPQSFSVEFSGNQISGFSYSAMSPSPSGDTFFSCYFGAERSNGESIWKDEGKSVKVVMKEPVAEEDMMFLTRMKDTVTLRLEVSPSNCGHSTAFASSITITRGKKVCRDIEMNN